MNNTQLLLFEQFSSTEQTTRQSAFCTLADRVLSPPPLWEEAEQDTALSSTPFRSPASPV